MRRVLPACLTLSLLLLPVLCLAGAIEHACRDSEVTELCGHEENCAKDPCIEDQARTESNGAGDRGPSVESRAVRDAAHAVPPRNGTPAIPDEFATFLRSIPVFESDRPLLN